jgi:hypothetical protein
MISRNSTGGLPISLPHTVNKQYIVPLIYYVWSIEDVAQANWRKNCHLSFTLSIYNTLSNPLQGQKESMPNFLKTCSVSYWQRR